MATKRSKSGAAFKPRKQSEKTTQTSGTPPEFLCALEYKFGVSIDFDIACTQQNCVSNPTGYVRIACDADGTPNPQGKEWIGRQTIAGYWHDLGVDALAQDWRTITQKTSFYNPEFSDIWPWVEKTALGTDTWDEAKGEWVKGTRIFSLLPAGVGTEWFRKKCEGNCKPYFLSPRMAFIDPSTGEPFKSPKMKKNADGNKVPVLDDYGNQVMQDMSINRDCMLLDWGTKTGKPSVFECWNWKDTYYELLNDPDRFVKVPRLARLVR